MNEQLQGKLVEILAGIQSATKAAGDFALEQLPDIAQQYVMFGRASLTFYVVASVILICVAAFFSIKQSIKLEDGFPAFVGAAVSIAPGLIVMVNLNSFFLVWFAPKVWLLKEIASLIK